MSTESSPAAEVLRPLIRTRQIRDFTDEAVSDEALASLADVARWTGSSRNEQPWRFLVLRDGGVLRRLAHIGLPQTKPLLTATAAIAIVLPRAPAREVQDAYDDGRAAERILIAASMLDLGAGVAWVRRDVRDPVAEILGLPADWFVRTLMAIGHPTAAARQPKVRAGQGARPARGDGVRGALAARLTYAVRARADPQEEWSGPLFYLAGNSAPIRSAAWAVWTGAVR